MKAIAQRRSAHAKAERFLLALLLLLAASMRVDAASVRQEQSSDSLEQVVILMRHGVRAAMSTPEQLAQYSVRPWPAFSVPPGHLTPQGEVLVGLLGRYYRTHYRALGLLKQGDCEAGYFWANRTQRTEATARALAKELLPGCEATVHTLAEGFDPLFDAHPAGIVRPDYVKVQASILGRMGGDPAAWSAAQSAGIEVLDALLLQCPSVPCPAEAGSGKRRLRDTQSIVGVGGPDKLVVFDAPAAAASTITESLLMSYADGHSFTEAGWSGVTEQTLLQVFAPHTAQFEMRTRTRYIAELTSSHLAARILATLQAGAGLPYRHERIGGPNDVIVIAGHDGTLSQLGGLLDIDWVVPGYQQNQVVPGGGLVFEVWRRAADRRVVLRLRYVAQSLKQLREGRPLTAAQPPLSAPIFIPGCSESAAAFDCPLDRLATLLDGPISSHGNSSIRF